MAELAYEGGELALFAEARNWKRYLARALGPYLRGDVLEVGAGLGTTTRALLGAGNVRAWSALEPDRALFERLERTADELTQQSDIAVRARLGTLVDEPRERAFDTVLYVDVLEHIADDADELAQAAQRVRPGGHIVVLAPAHQALYSEFDRQVGHHRRYDKRSLRALTPVGCELVASGYLDSVGVLASLANRVLLRASLPTRGQIELWDSAMVPASRVLDVLTCHLLGKSILCAWRID